MSKIKVLLVRPYYGVNVSSDMSGDFGHFEYIGAISPDLGIVFGATILEKCGNKVKVYDCNAIRMKPNSFFSEISKEKELDIIIVKVSAPTILLDISFAEHLKEKFKKVKIIIAGHPTLYLKNNLQINSKYIDEVISIPLEEYCYFLATGKDNNISINDFPSPNYTLFPYQYYKERTGKNIAFLWGSRGCIMNCAYCPYKQFYGTIDKRSNEKILEDIKSIYRLGITTLQFRDPFFTYDIKKTIDLCKKIIDSNIKIEWYCDTRIDSLTDEVIEWLYRSGCRMLFVGIESASENILSKYSRKKFEVLDLKNKILKLRNMGIRVMGLYMIGFPDESLDDIKNTYDFAEEINTDYIHFNPYIPYPYNTNMNPEEFDKVVNRKSNVCKKIFNSEIDFLSQQLDFAYSMKRIGLKESLKIYEFQNFMKKRSMRISNNMQEIS